MNSRLVAAVLGTLGFKLALMQLFLLFSDALLAYGLVQVFVFLGSYALHRKITFRTSFGWRSLRDDLRTMVVFQALDYVVFAVIFTRFTIDSTDVILMATGVVFLLRYLFVRRSLRGARPTELPA